MKFGKLLLQAAENSSSHIAESDWMNYKLLKKELKKMYGAPPESATQRTRDNKELQQTAAGRRFFKLVQGELRRATEVFKKMERESLLEFTKFLRVLGQYQSLLEESNGDSSKTDTPSNDTTRVPGIPPIPVDLSSTEGRIYLQNFCINLHEQLLLVANFAVLNYCGFTKILKKHDKFSGFQTKEKFMSNIAAKSPLAQQTVLNTAISRIELEFKKLQSNNASGELGMQGSNSLPSRNDLNSTQHSGNLASEKASSLRKEGLDLLATLATAERNGDDNRTSASTSGSDNEVEQSVTQQLVGKKRLASEVPQKQNSFSEGKKAKV